MMKQLSVGLGFLCVLLAVTAESPSAGHRKSRAGVGNSTNTFVVQGMHCDGCAKGLCSELKSTPGVSGAVVTLSNRLARIVFDSNRVDTVRLLKVVEDAGFSGKPLP
jgi:copper chaperone